MYQNYLKLFILFFFTQLAWAELAESDRRINTLEPGEARLRLKYHKQHGNFVVFYDFVGTPLYLKFRRDKWDYSGDRVINELLSGHTYFVELNFRDFYPLPPDPLLYSLETINRDTETTSPRPIRPDPKVGVGTLRSYEIALFDDLRY